MQEFYLGAIARNFPYITPKSVLARLVYCKQPPLRRLITEAFQNCSKDSCKKLTKELGIGASLLGIIINK
ncbi:MAG: hypothetical protein EWV87_05555 [Microcystis panniformis Mp_GB_SS_20050300_S99]|nr:MAG: hypothetical protein EWV87_05555 [Microcystis panniformis Mp_GB_SS_20050300_S99]